MRGRTRAVALLATVVLSGCVPRLASPDAPAVLTHPTARWREELAQVVSRALNGAPVTLAESALTTSDVLIVGRTERRDAQGRNLNGRELSRPDHFRLVKHGSRCVLVHEETGRRWTLRSATCAPR
jgi:hypothetical protein